MLDSNYLRTPLELKTRYTLEPSLKELFVEGESDKALFLNYVRKRNLQYKVYPISSVNTSSLFSEEEKASTNENNIGDKQRVERLSIYFEKNLGVRTKCIYCICDRDDDGFINASVTNSYLLTTDFACLESYILDVNVLQKFFDTLLHKKSPTAEKILHDVLEPMQFLFNVRLTRYLLNKSWTPVTVAKAVAFTKQGTASFNVNTYLVKLMGHNREVNSRQHEFLEIYNLNSIQFKDVDYRLVMHGHDFTSLLNNYQRQLGGQNIDDDIFERVLLGAIEAEDLDNYPLFQVISACNT